MLSDRETGMTKERKIAVITEALQDVSIDILDLLYKIILYAESGLE